MSTQLSSPRINPWDCVCAVHTVVRKIMNLAESNHCIKPFQRSGTDCPPTSFVSRSHFPQLILQRALQLKVNALNTGRCTAVIKHSGIDLLALLST